MELRFLNFISTNPRTRGSIFGAVGVSLTFAYIHESEKRVAASPGEHWRDDIAGRTRRVERKTARDSLSNLRFPYVPP